MKNKLVLCASLFTLSLLFTSGLVRAQSVSTEAFMKYTNPHDICDYYRSQGINVVRESDNECLTSLGEGQYTVYTQYYYSNNQWCYKLTQQGQTQYGNCIAIPKNNTVADSFGDFFNDLHIDSKNEPYILAGAAVVILAVILSVSSAHHARLKASQASTTETEEPEKAFNPKVKRSGKGSYGWEQMETTTTEEFNAKPPKGPEADTYQGGVGLHDEPVVKSTADELEKLLKLKNKGALTEKEFELAKKKLLR